MPPIPWKTPAWADPEQASVLDPWHVRTARLVGRLIGADDPASQVMGLAGAVEVPAAKAATKAADWYGDLLKTVAEGELPKGPTGAQWRELLKRDPEVWERLQDWAATDRRLAEAERRTGKEHHLSRNALIQAFADRPALLAEARGLFPESVPVYRGGVEPVPGTPTSWTTQRDIAENFRRRYGRYGGQLHEGTVSPEDILGLGPSLEKEVFIDPARVRPLRKE